MLSTERKISVKILVNMKEISRKFNELNEIFWCVSRSFELGKVNDDSALNYPNQGFRAEPCQFWLSLSWARAEPDPDFSKTSGL